MFFIMGIYDKEYPLAFDQMVVCPFCGRYTRVQVVMVCIVFSVFFIPLIKFNRRYQVRFGCCQSAAALSAELGRQIEKGTLKHLSEQDLPRPAIAGRKVCTSCGFSTTEAFDYCPKCGRPLR